MTTATDSPAPVAHVSYSALNSWTRCGEAFRLERVVKVPTIPSWFFVGGNAVHTATEWYDLGQAEGRDAQQLFTDALAETVAETVEKNPEHADPKTWKVGGRRSKDWPNKENAAWWAHHGPLMVQAWIDWMAQLQWQPATDLTGGYVEVVAPGTIGGAPVKAFIDRMFITPEGELVIVDLKTGSREPVSALQLGWYAELVEQSIGVRPSWGGYWMAREGKLGELRDLTKYTTARLDRWTRDFIKARELGLYLPRVDTHCSTCGVAKACIAVGGVDAWKYEEIR